MATIASPSAPYNPETSRHAWGSATPVGVLSMRERAAFTGSGSAIERAYRKRGLDPVVAAGRARVAADWKAERDGREVAQNAKLGITRTHGRLGRVATLCGYDVTRLDDNELARALEKACRDGKLDFHPKSKARKLPAGHHAEPVSERLRQALSRLVSGPEPAPAPASEPATSTPPREAPREAAARLEDFRAFTAALDGAGGHTPAPAQEPAPEPVQPRPAKPPSAPFPAARGRGASVYEELHRANLATKPRVRVMAGDSQGSTARLITPGTPAPCTSVPTPRRAPTGSPGPLAAKRSAAAFKAHRTRLLRQGVTGEPIARIERELAALAA